MPIAVFGNKVFEITDSKIYTLDGLQYSTTLQTEKQDAEGKKSSTYNKGPGLNGLSFTLKLNVNLGINPRRELEEWESIKDASTAYPFVLGSKPFGANKYLLVEANGSNFIIDNEGNILALDLELKFDEYVRHGSAAASKTSAKSSSGAVAVKTSVSSPKPISYDSPDKSGLKRNNQAIYVDEEALLNY